MQSSTSKPTAPDRRCGCRQASLLAAFVLSVLAPWPAKLSADFLQDWAQQFADSEIRFQRSTSQVPFPPLAYADVSYYGDTEIRLQEDAAAITFDQRNVSQAAGVPLLLSPRDALVVGEWVSWSNFDVNETQGAAEALDATDFDVLTIGLPIGWFRQASPDWQTAAFVMPLAHRASFAGADWSFEWMGGAFARYVHNERLWWAFGLFADVGPGFDLYLPYAGVSWAVDDHWTVSAVMPWPALLYAPNPDTLWRLGLSPSGASWSIDRSAGEASLDLGGWDFGLGYERRLAGPFWARMEAGISGLRGLTLNSNGSSAPELDHGSAWFVSLSLNLRPTALD